MNTYISACIDRSDERTDAAVFSFDDLIPQRPPIFDARRCAGVPTDLFYPEAKGESNRAVRICRGCPAQAECAAEALARREPAGVFGGLLVQTRKKLIRHGYVRNWHGDEFLWDAESGEVYIELSEAVPVVPVEDAIAAVREARSSR